MRDKTIKINKADLKQDMELAINIYNAKGSILVAEGTKLKNFHIKSIQSMEKVDFVEVWPSEREEDSSNSLSSDENASEKELTVDEIRKSVSEKVRENLTFYSDKSESNLKVLFKVVQQIIDSVLSSENLVYEIGKINSSDEYLYNHCINSTILSLLIGIAVGFKSNELYSLARGAFFSDIGKLMMDPELINKESELSEEEYQLIKKYPEYGYNLMKGYEEMDENALDCILHSREKIDGTGYPHGLKGDEISIYAQIVGLATFFDSLCSKTSYRDAFNPYKAMSLAMEEEGVYFSRDLLKKMVKILGYYDVGMLVELNSSDIAIVVKKCRYKPLLNVVNLNKNRRESHVYEIDMVKNPSVKIKDVIFKSELTDKMK